MRKLFTSLILAVMPIIAFSQNITSISPTSGNAGQTLDVTITGNNTHFDQGSATTVDFYFNQGSGTTIVNSINVISATSLIANISIPTNTYAGVYYVHTYNDIDGYMTNQNIGFHVNGITPPELTAITPTLGNAGQTLDVTITGNNTHFDQGSGTTVDFNFYFGQGSGTTVVNSINVISATSLTANITIPSDTYTGDYTVQTYDVIDGYIGLYGFHVNGIAPPSLSAISPNTGNTGQTLDVTITGSNTHFDQGSGTTVDFSFGFNQGSGTTVVNSININSATSLTANITIPSNTYTGDYNVNTYNSFDGNLYLSDAFHVNGLTPPSLASISPNAGNAGQTLDVTITGSNTHFDQGSGTTINFGFDQGSGTIVVNSININSATSLTANITIPSNTAAGNYYVGTYNGIDGYISMYNAFNVNGTLNLTGNVVPTNTSQNGTCDGSAALILSGGTAPYTYLFSNGSTDNSASNLCEGLYSVSVSDALGSSITIPFVIASPSNIYTNPTSYQDSTLIDSIYNSAISNCVINYSSIDSVFISNFNILPNNFVNVTWNVFYSDSSVTITDIYGLDPISGVYMLALQLYCPNKSIGQFLTAYDQIYFDKSLSGIDKIERNFISVYPNPFKDQITISLENDQASEVIISDIGGKVIVNQKFNERVIHLDMNGLSAGQYIVTVKNETSVITRKIVK